jgi:hypothetical protein
MSSEERIEPYFGQALRAKSVSQAKDGIKLMATIVPSLCSLLRVRRLDRKFEIEIFKSKIHPDMMARYLHTPSA